MVKLILMIVVLLLAAFVSGVAIGKNGRSSVDRTSSDEKGVQATLSDCISNADKYRGQYMKLREAAREKKLVDKNDVLIPNVVCKSVETIHETSPQKPEPPEKSDEPESVETSSETSPQEQSEPVEKPEKPVEPKPEPAETKPAETLHETSPQKESEPAEKPAQKGDTKKCRFSIQIASLDSLEQVKASKKQFKSLKLRTVSGESKGKKWFKVRTGCFDSHEAAEEELPKVRNVKKDAFIVSE